MSFAQDSIDAMLDRRLRDPPLVLEIPPIETFDYIVEECEDTQTQCEAIKLFADWDS